MSEVELLPTGNPEWGAWGTARSAGYDPAMLWEAAFRALLEGVEGLTPAMARRVLDSRFGRHWVDSLQRHEAADAAAVRRRMLDSITDRGWWEWLARELDEPARRRVRARWIEDTFDPVTLRLLDLANAGLGVKTFRARGSDRLDFREVSVVALGAVLRAAYEAGLAAGRGDPREPTTGARQG
jgi:hypothetical protein